MSVGAWISQKRVRFAGDVVAGSSELCIENTENQLRFSEIVALLFSAESSLQPSFYCFKTSFILMLKSNFITFDVWPNI